MNVYALNEFNLDKTDWRKTLDLSLMNVFSQEISDNSFKVSRWIIQSVLSGVDFIKYAFVTRRDMNDPTKGHEVLQTHTLPIEK